MSLRDLIQDDASGIDAIASYLDNLSADERLAETRTLDRNAQRSLYKKAAKSRPLTLEDFVPPGTKPRTQVVHNGRNTLHLPGGLKLFKKCMSLPDQPGERGGRIFGYNDSPFESTVGPGFFVAVPTKGNPAWEDRGAVVVDYFQVPDGAVPDGWPKVIPNTKGLQRFVYNRTRDFMRRVSSHVTIGAAFREEKSMDHYFMLCRDSS